MRQPTTAEELFATVRNMPPAERARFFSMLGTSAFENNYSHTDVFGDLDDAEFTAAEAAEYLEVSLPTFRRHVQSSRITPTRIVGRNQFFATPDLKSFKRSMRDIKGRSAHWS